MQLWLTYTNAFGEEAFPLSFPPSPRFAYGEKGEEDLEIPADAHLNCIVKLIEFTPDISPLDIPITERQQIGWALKSYQIEVH